MPKAAVKERKEEKQAARGSRRATGEVKDVRTAAARSTSTAKHGRPLSSPRPPLKPADPLAEAVPAEAPSGCAHHWVIASPNGEMSTGRCKICGLEKEFPNSAEDYLWERSVPQSRWTGRADPNSMNSGY